MKSINIVAMTGNLTADPELRTTHGGTAVMTLRLANNVRRRVGQKWGDKTSYFDVEVWGTQAEACAEHLAKGSRIAVQGQIEIDELNDAGRPRRLRPVISQASVTFEGRSLRSARRVPALAGG